MARFQLEKNLFDQDYLRQKLKKIQRVGQRNKRARMFNTVVAIRVDFSRSLECCLFSSPKERGLLCLKAAGYQTSLGSVIKSLMGPKPMFSNSYIGKVCLQKKTQTIFFYESNSMFGGNICFMVPLWIRSKDRKLKSII